MIFMLKMGDKVQIKNLNTKGEIIDIQFKNNPRHWSNYKVIFDDGFVWVFPKNALIKISDLEMKVENVLC